jgi:hypothetical protein
MALGLDPLPARHRAHPGRIARLAGYRRRRWLALVIAGSGRRDVEWTNLTFGVVATHAATKA